MDLASTIVAVSSPPGRSPRGLVRISGARAMDVLAPILQVDDARRGIFRSAIDLGSANLPVLVIIFRGPHSATGEDVVELYAPGNPMLLERVVERIIETGTSNGIETRRAEAGEFTARAFFSGRINLTEAEGVAHAIGARSDAEVRAARLLTGDALGRFARAQAQRITRALALVEAGIDFTDEEDVTAIERTDLHHILTEVRNAIDDEIEHAVGTEQLEAIPWVVLAGPPNAGKSSLFNALLRRDRAVVTDDRGTTRDVLVEPLEITTDRANHEHGEVLLVDVAGEEADDGRDPLDELMQEARRDAHGRADLIIDCVPSGAREKDAAPGRIVVSTKCDLGGSRQPGLRVSARTGEGVDELRRMIGARLSDRAVSLQADALALRPRHDAALRAASSHLGTARADLAAGDRSYPAELVATSMRAALDELGLMTGEITPDDVLDHVFASFCVGK